MPGKAAKVPLSEKQLGILQQIVRESTAAVRLVQRCGMILLGFEGRLNEDIAAEVKLVPAESRRRNPFGLLDVVCNN